jgi:hypothetical protein
MGWAVPPPSVSACAACPPLLLRHSKSRSWFQYPHPSPWRCPPPVQLVQGKLADMYTTTRATRAFVHATARAADAGRADRKDCAAVILYAAEHATRMALDAIQILGGNG